MRFIKALGRAIVGLPKLILRLVIRLSKWFLHLLVLLYYRIFGAWLDERYKYTLRYHFKPFFISLFVLLICSCMLTLCFFISCTPVSIFLGGLFAASFVNFVVRTVPFAQVFYYIYGVEKHLQDLRKGRVVVYEGAPGTGKSLSMHYDSYYAALYQWQQYVISFMKLEANYRRNDYEFASFNDYFIYRIFKSGFIFYCENISTAIPCLFTRKAVREKDVFGGRFSYKLKFEHFMQTEALPEKCVIVEDESADDFSNLRFKDKDLSEENKRLSETISKERHFWDAYLYFAEQDAGENYIAIRRVVSFNRYLHELTKTLEPFNLLNKIDKLHSKIYSRFYCSDKIKNKLDKLEKRAARIGFIRIDYEERGNTQKSNKVLERSFYVLPKNTPIEYSARAYMFDCKSLDLPLNVDIWQDLMD